MISVSHLTRRFGARVAVDDVSFEIGKAEVVGFLGPNGAGKTTTMRVLAGGLAPSSGVVTVAGHDVVDASLEARRAVGYMPEGVPLYPEMRVVEYVRFRAELKGVARRHRASWADDAMAKAGALAFAHRRIGHLSKGMRQRVGLADALVARPPVVLLDEPTAGLDPNQIREARELVRALGQEHTVLLSTHVLSEAEACASRVLVLHHGKLLAAAATDELRAMRAPATVDLVVRGHVPAALSALANVEGVADIEREEVGGLTRLRVRFVEETPAGDRARATERCVAAAVAAGAGVSEVRPATGSLEDVFAALTRESPTDERAP